MISGGKILKMLRVKMLVNKGAPRLSLSTQALASLKFPTVEPNSDLHFHFNLDPIATFNSLSTEKTSAAIHRIHANTNSMHVHKHFYLSPISL